MRLEINRKVYRDFRVSAGAQALVNQAAAKVASGLGSGYGWNPGSAAGTRYRAYVRAISAMGYRDAARGGLMKKAASLGLEFGVRVRR